MRYLVVAERCFLDAPGGAARVAWDFAQLMRDKGHDVTLFCQHHPQSREPPDSITHQQGMRVVRYKRRIMPAWHPRRLQGIISAASQGSRTFLAGVSWDIVHLHSPLIGRGVLEALGSGPLYVYTAHSPIVLEQKINWGQGGSIGKLKLLAGLPALRRLERNLLRDCHQVHALSTFTREHLARDYGFGEKIAVVPHWLTETSSDGMPKADARHALGWPQDKKIFFSVRQLRYRYGLDVAIRSIASIPNKSEVRYYIAGQGALRHSLETLTQELGASENIQFLGRISDPDLALAYQAADVFLLPTRELECFGLIILEALSRGCPVIGTDAGAIPEVLNAVLSDCIVRSGDVASLSEKLNAVLDGKVDFPAPGTIRSRAEAVYGARQIVPRILNLFDMRLMTDKSASVS